MAFAAAALTIRSVKTLLICHDGSRLTQLGLSRWLASFSELAGVVVLRETDERVRKRMRREMQRVGRRRFLDVVAFRAYYRLFLAGRCHCPSMSPHRLSVSTAPDQTRIIV